MLILLVHPILLLIQVDLLVQISYPVKFEHLREKIIILLDHLLPMTLWLLFGYRLHYIHHEYLQLHAYLLDGALELLGLFFSELNLELCLVLFGLFLFLFSAALPCHSACLSLEVLADERLEVRVTSRVVFVEVVDHIEGYACLRVVIFIETATHFLYVYEFIKQIEHRGRVRVLLNLLLSSQDLQTVNCRQFLVYIKGRIYGAVGDAL